MDKETKDMLISKALAARDMSYCPYSDFAVGAALMTKSGKVITGANVESASYSPTVCAERVAFFSAIHSGERDFSAIAVVGGKRGASPTSYSPPCGVCRQVMAEFCDGDFEIILFDGREAKSYTLSDLLPEGFGRSNLN